MQTADIYRIRCTRNGREYIGQSLNHLARKHTHLSDLYWGRHSNKALQRDFDAYGEAAFVFELIRRVAASVTLAEEQAEIRAARAAGVNLYNHQPRQAPYGMVQSGKNAARIPWREMRPFAPCGVSPLTLTQVARYLKVSDRKVIKLTAAERNPLPVERNTEGDLFFDPGQLAAWLTSLACRGEVAP